MKKSFTRSLKLTFLIIAFLTTVYFFLADMSVINYGNNPLAEPLSPVEKIDPQDRIAADFILLGARQEVHNKTHYNASYQVMEYPGGDGSRQDTMGF